MSVALSALVGVGLDAWLGEPRRWHPLVGFGHLAQRIEQRLNSGGCGWRSHGVSGWCLAVLPPVLLVWLLSLSSLGWLIDILVLYFALGLKSLAQHALPVAQALRLGDLDEARRRVGYLVSRRTSELDACGVARAATESVLENGADAVFASLFWFAVLGAPGVLLHRLSNTLDAMWGYRTPRYRHFGWAAARLDDLLNWAPARLTALAYALVGHFRPALACWRTQGRLWKSPNAGPVMAAGAGSLGILLGGAASYHGAMQDRPSLGLGPAARAEDIFRAMRLIRHALALWLVTVPLLALAVS